MTGKEEKDLKVYNEIMGIIEKNKEKDYLLNFFYFLSTMAMRSAKAYLLYVINFINYTNKTPENLTLNDYTAYMFSINDKTSAYKIAVYSALKKFSIFLKINGINNANPMEYVHRPKAIESQATKQKREIGYLNKKEIQIYLNNVNNKNKTVWGCRDVLIVYLFLNTGMRCSALEQINVEDIDFEKKELTVYEKEDKVITYTLSDFLVEKIITWLNYRNNMNLKTNAVFVSNQLNRMSNVSIYRVIKKYGFNIEGKKLSPHKLRATYGTQLYDATKDIIFVQKAMNHNNSHTTELYIRGKEDVARKQASDIMAKLTFN